MAMMPKVGVALLILVASASQANNNACPAAEDIVQTVEGQGIAYAANGGGPGWAGENPMADKASGIKFKEAYILSKKNRVICDYTSDADGIRLAFQSPFPVTPLGDAWSDQKQQDGGVLAHCSAADPVSCAFK